MVKVRQEYRVSSDGSVDLDSWLAELGDRQPEINLDEIRSVCELSEQAQKKAQAMDGDSGPGSYQMGLEIAEILSGLRVNEDGLKAGIIYRAVRENQITVNHVRKQCGEQVAQLVEGVLRMAAISSIRFGDRKPVLGERKDQLEQARRMLIALVDDVRVALIKLAERTCAIRRNAERIPEEQLSLAREVFEIYAPLAHRLGIGHLKWELEDHAFRYLEPLSYKRIAKLLDEKRLSRQEYIDNVIEELETKLQSFGIEVGLEGRAKHIYSIWHKMREKGITFSEVHDVRAIRLLVSSTNDCYRVLGVVHSLWRSIPHEFDDYIANPKENGYRSLHTAVIGPEGKVLEVQIRTEEMHEEAEYGVCSHWRYKEPEGKSQSEMYEERLEWLRQILDWQEEFEDAPDLAKEILDDVGMDRVYMYTPKGHVVDMSPGATPVDFAYRVHTEVGHRCRGAKVNGKVVPLNTQLKSGDQVEIITGEEAEPRREWLYEHLRFTSTSRAKSKIHSWFMQREKRKNIEEGKKLLVNELDHLGLAETELKKITENVQASSLDALCYAIGVGDEIAAEVIDRAIEVTELQDSQLSLEFSDIGPEKVIVAGLGGKAYTMAECCNPVPGDSIVGVIDDDALVHVHLQDCLQALQADVYGRLIRLDWQDEVNATFPVGIEVSAYDRAGLLYDITGIFMREDTNVLSIKMVSDNQDNTVILKMVIEVSTLSRLLRTMESIEQLPNILGARRTVTS